MHPHPAADPTRSYRDRMPPTRRRRPAKRRPKKTTAALPVPGKGERVWVLDLPYGTRLPDVRYNATVKASVYVGATLTPATAPYASRPYTYERWVEDTLNKGRPGPPLSTPPMTPRETQVEGARAIVRAAASGAPAFLLGDDTGVGKTVTAVLAAKAVAHLRKGSTVLVVADRPAAITISHWCRTIGGIGDGGLTWCVTTWDRISKVARHRWDVVIADEAQMVKSTETKRWKAWSMIAGYNRAADGPFVVYASATPGHSPLELPYLAPLFAHANGQPKQTWTTNFPQALSAAGVKGKYGSQGTDARTRAADTRLVRSWMTQGPAPAMIHRPAPWGPCQVTGMGVTLTAEERAAYNAEWAEFQAAMHLARRGKNASAGRAAVLRYRQKAGLVRVEATADWVAAQIDAGRQVAVSCQYVETAADPLTLALRERGVDVATIYGQGRFDPEEQRLRFQRGIAKAVVLTPTASLSLHAKELLPDGTHATDAPRVGVFHQARYSGIQGKQVTGRTHRDGQRSDWHITYAENTVEEDVAKIMVERYAAAADTVGGDTNGLSKIAALLGCDWLPADTLTEGD